MVAVFIGHVMNASKARSCTAKGLPETPLEGWKSIAYTMGF